MTKSITELENIEIALIITCKEAPEYKVNRNHFKKLAKKYNIPFIDTADISSSKIFNLIKKLKPMDYGLSHNFVNLIPEKIIKLFRHGILNAHGGDLPRFRGNACQAWAILNKEKYVALCIHKMNKDSFDSGNVIVKKKLKININIKIKDIIDWIYTSMPQQFEIAINKIEKNKNYLLYDQKKTKIKPLRCYPRLPSDSKIDFNVSSHDLLRLINASGPPFKGAFCKYKNKKFYILEAELYEDNEKFLGIPGQICEIKKEGHIVILLKNSKIKITKCRYDDVKVKPAKIIKSLRDRLT